MLDTGVDEEEEEEDAVVLVKHVEVRKMDGGELAVVTGNETRCGEIFRFSLFSAFFEKLFSGAGKVAKEDV